MFWFYGTIMAIGIVSIVLSLPTVKGKFGEAKVSFVLNRLDEENYFILNDLLIPTENGKTTQIDHVVVSPFGIFVLETKNYQGWIFGDEKSKYWTQTIYKRKERFYNPVRQNYGHIKSIEAVLEDIYDGPFYSLIVFSSKATLKKINVSSSNVKVINTLQSLRTIKGFRESVIHMGKVNQIVDQLNKVNIQDKEALKNHVKEIKNNQNKVKSIIKSNTCPKCGGNLIKRNGKYGQFMGCGNYPKCRFISKKTS
jgi:hypothetical protein